MSRFGRFTAGKGAIINNWNTRKSPSSIISEAPKTVREIDYSQTQGIWDLKSTTQFAKRQSNTDNINFADISGAKGEVSGDIVLPRITSNQMIVFMERANSATPPALRSGFTNITTASITSPAARSMRLQYRIGGGSETLSTATAASYIVLNNARSVGVTIVSQTTAAASTTITIPAISGINTDGKSFVYATTYYPTVITGVGSPYTLRSGIGGYIQNTTASSIPTSTFTTSAASYTIISVIEFRP